MRAPDNAIACRPPRAGEPAQVALPKLVDLYGGLLYRLGVRFCRKHEDAQDLVQETFLQAYRRWDRFEGRAAPKTWLFTIAARTCQRMHRRRAGEPTHVESLDDAFPFDESPVARLASPEEDPGKGMGRRELREQLEEAVSRLPAAFRVPLILKDILDLPLADVAAILNVKAQTVKTRVHRARLKLREALVDELPRQKSSPALYSRRVCLDLLRAKMEAMDRGAAFPVGQSVMCARCQSVFATLDLGRDLCLDMGTGALPKELRKKLIAEFRAEV